MRWWRAAGAAAGVAALTLGYGYWFGRTHGALYISVSDLSERDRAQTAAPVTLAFLDAAGATLAEARSTEPFHTISISSPFEYVCSQYERIPLTDEARTGWQACFGRQSRWIPAWIRRVTAVNLQAGACRLDRIPVSIAEYPDTWWLWWVPLPHIGGNPYTSFSLNLQIDVARCTRVPV